MKTKINKWILTLPYLLMSLVLVFVPLIFIFVKAFLPTTDSLTKKNYGIEQNWNFLQSTVAEKIWLSLWISVVSTLLTIIFGYLFAYFLSLTKNLFWKTLWVTFTTTPIWISLLVKVVGIKTFFDLNAQAPNSTFGHFFTILTFVYLNLPLFIITIYAFIITIPNNLLNASKDLGKNCWQTFWHIIVPLSKKAILNGTSLVFFTIFTSSGVSQFVNNANDNGLIGSSLLEHGLIANANQIALARVSSVTLLLSCTILFLWCACYLIPKIIINHYWKKRKNS